MKIALMADIIDRETLHEVLADWEGRLADGHAETATEAVALLRRLLTTECEREYEREREAYHEAYEHEAYATWED